MKPKAGSITERLEGKYREGNEILALSEHPRKRILIGIPMTGLVRSEWMIARYGQVIPCNWSQVDSIQWLNAWSPIDFMVADARNVLACQCVEQGFEWLFFIDHDVVLPPITIIKMNDRMIKGEVPIWSGLYFTKSKPSEPLIYRGRGNGYFPDWKLGDEVWVDGLPMGCTMIHRSILQALYADSEEYLIPGGSGPDLAVRKIFETPAKVWFAPELRTWYTVTGTEDLRFCTRIMNEGIFKKAGWDEYEDKEFPFLIDTSIFCRHIDFDGIQYPANNEEMQFMPKEFLENEEKEGDAS